MAQDFMTLDVQHDLDRVRKELGHVRNSIPIAMSAALNKTAAGVRTDAGKPLAKLTGLGVNAVKKAIKLRKAGPGHLTAILEARARPLNMIRFMTGAQIRAWVGSKKRPRKPLNIGGARKAPWGKPRKYARGAAVFIGNSGRTVFVRESKRRGDIRGMWGPSLPREMVNAEIRAAILMSKTRRWNVEINRAIKDAKARALKRR